MNVESVLKNHNFKKFLLAGGLIIIAILLIWDIYTVVFFDSVFNKIKKVIHSQEKSVQVMQGKSNRDLKQIGQGMRGVANEINEGQKNMMDEIDTFHNNFSAGLSKLQEQDRQMSQKLQRASVEYQKMIVDAIKLDEIEWQKKEKSFFENSEKRRISHKTWLKKHNPSQYQFLYGD